MIAKLDGYGFNRAFALIVSFVLIIFELVNYIVLYSHYESRKSEYLKTISVEWQQEFDSTINSYKMLTEAMSKNITKDSDLIAILKNVNSSKNYKEAHDAIFSKYAALYDESKIHNMRIFEFQNLTGNVLARFQKPDKYGDCVIDYRKTIQNAYDTKKVVSDFEAGKYFHAFRFVYPIVSDGVLLGSVEFGFDEPTLYDTLQKNFKMDAYYVMDSNRTSSANKEFSASCLPIANNRFVHSNASYSKENISFISKLFDGKAREITNAVSAGNEFDFSAYIGEDAYAVTLKPYVDFGGNIAGFMTLYSKDSVLPMLKKEFRYALSISSVLVFIVWLVVVRYMLYYRRTKLELSKKSAEQKAHLKAVIDTIPEYIWLKDQNGVYISCNPKFEFFFGAKESEIIGKTDYDFVSAELATFFRQKDKEAMANDIPTTNTEWVTLAGDGKRVLLETIKTPLKTETGELIGVLGVARDITELWKVNDELQKKERTLESTLYMKDYLYEILNTIGIVGRSLISEKSVDEIKNECCSVIASHGRYALAWIGEIVDDKIVISSHSYDPMGYVEQLDLSLDPTNPTSRGPSAQSIIRNETIVTQSINLDYYAMWRDEAKNSGIGSSICLPLRAHAGEKPFAVLSIYSVKAFGFITEEIAMLEGLAGDIGYVIASRSRKEELVGKLEKSEYTLRFVLDGMTDGVAIYEAVDGGDDFAFVNINKAAEKIDGIKSSDIVGKRVTEVFPAIDKTGIMEAFKRVYRTGKPEHVPVCLYEDSRSSGWRENYIFRLPSTEVVAVYEDATVRMKAEIALQETDAGLDK